MIAPLLHYIWDIVFYCSAISLQSRYCTVCHSWTAWCYYCTVSCYNDCHNSTIAGPVLFAISCLLFLLNTTVPLHCLAPAKQLKLWLCKSAIALHCLMVALQLQCTCWVHWSNFRFLVENWKQAAGALQRRHIAVWFVHCTVHSALHFKLLQLCIMIPGSGNTWWDHNCTVLVQE